MPEPSALIPEDHVRQDLESAAAELFARRGYTLTTVDEIVEAAGVSKPGLYRHFESKRQLYMVLLERHRGELAAVALDAGFGPFATVDLRLRSMLDAWFAYVEDHPFCWLLLRDTTGDPEMRALHLELQDRQRAMDAAVLREFAPGLPEEELEPLAEIIRSSLYALALLWRDRQDLERATLVNAMMRVVRGVLLTAREAGQGQPAR